MIRFVEISGCYLDKTKSFGFYNTVTDSFLSFNGDVVLDSVQEFEEEYCEDCGYPYERLKRLIPKRWYKINAD